MKRNQVIGYSKGMAIVLDEEDRLYGITCTDPEYYFPLGAAVSEELLDAPAKKNTHSRTGCSKSKETALPGAGQPE